MVRTVLNKSVASTLTINNEDKAVREKIRDEPDSINMICVKCQSHYVHCETLNALSFRDNNKNISIRSTLFLCVMGNARQFVS